MENKRLENIFEELVPQLKSQQNEEGFWSGHLASSALATAVAMVALKINNEKPDNDLILNGLDWILNHQNEDGGFGDTPESVSNVSTTLLSYAAIRFCGGSDTRTSITLDKINKYLSAKNIDLTKGDITSTVLSFYGNDFTFSVPILSMLVICGVLDNEACRKIPQLPFEFTLLPAKWYSFFNLRVVSYAIPALIAVGIFVFKKRKHYNPVTRWIRNKSMQPALRKLEKIVPESGGFLEAIPLTAFVAMCLSASGLDNNEVTTKGLSFLRNQQRADGSWPIDTDLSTWVTTSGIKALGNQMPVVFSETETESLKEHLHSIQYKEVHPFNLAQPGGWGWTNYSGSVPDVDDTSGAILALLELYKPNTEETEAIINGCRWLTSLQNKDGGFPTFCRGWSKLPFDSSCADLTGHALLALSRSLDIVGGEMALELQNSIRKSISRAFDFLRKAQHENGCWHPLWFGNQSATDHKNPVYGTAKVAIYLNDSVMCSSMNISMKKDIEMLLSGAWQYLLKQQNGDGSWGGESGVQGTMEETALSISALTEKDRDACNRGFEWLENEYKLYGLRSAPIGLYFAMLWYDEKLYPLIYYIEAIRRYLKPAESIHGAT